jgi:hypothetical protein
LSLQVSEMGKVVKARNEAVEWLLAESEIKDQTIRTLSEQLQATESELGKIKGSAGWRLLARYGRIKHRYVLPVGRRLGVKSKDE